MRVDTTKYQEYAKAIGEALAGQYDISDKTKAQLKEFATSIGLSVSTSLSKSAMIESILESGQFKLYNIENNEKARREAEKNFYLKYPEGYGI